MLSEKSSGKAAAAKCRSAFSDPKGNALKLFGLVLLALVVAAPLRADVYW